MPPWLCRLLPWLCPPPAAKPPPTPAPAPPPAGSLQDDWLAALNRERARPGLPPMAADPLLAESAQDWADKVAANGELTHGDFAGRIAAVEPGVPASEDVAEGQPDVAGVTASWMASAPHRAAMLGPYNRTGIGRAVGRFGMVYWVADFTRI